MKSLVPFACVIAFALPASADQTLSPTWAVGFQDVDGFDVTTDCGDTLLTQNVTSEVQAQDGVYAPRTEACILFDFYATGTSTHFFDALSVHFEDVGTIPAGARLFLETRIKRGNYGNWRALRLYQGAFNQEDSDCDFPICTVPGDWYPDIPGWEGVVTREVPLRWIAWDGSLDITVRMWNAMVDEVRLVIQEAPNPGECAGALVSATAFENDYYGCGPEAVRQDVLGEVCTQDGITAPKLEDCVVVDYLATGTSPGYLDALSLSFALTPGVTPVGIKLEAWVQKGSYHSTDWHAVKVMPGAFNPALENCDYPACWNEEDEFPGDPEWSGWIERTIPLSWITDDRLDLTMRVWNARIDVVRLVVDAPTPTSRISWGQIRSRYR